MLLAISLSLFSFRSTRQLMSMEHLWQRKKHTIFKFWGANMTLSVSAVSHPHSVSVREEGIWKKNKNKKTRQKYFLWVEGPKNVLFSQSQASSFVDASALHHKWQQVFYILLVQLRRGHIFKSRSAKVTLPFGCMQILQCLCNL